MKIANWISRCEEEGRGVEKARLQQLTQSDEGLSCEATYLALTKDLLDDAGVHDGDDSEDENDDDDEDEDE